MITAFIIYIFKLPKKIFDFLVNTLKKIKAAFVYLFVPDKKKNNTRKKSTQRR